MEELKEIHNSGIVESSVSKDAWLGDVMYRCKGNTYLISVKIQEGFSNSSTSSLSLFTHERGYVTIYSNNPVMEFNVTKNKSGVINSIALLRDILIKFIRE